MNYDLQVGRAQIEVENAERHLNLLQSGLDAAMRREVDLTMELDQAVHPTDLAPSKRGIEIIAADLASAAGAITELRRRLHIARTSLNAAKNALSAFTPAELE